MARMKTRPTLLLLLALLLAVVGARADEAADKKEVLRLAEQFADAIEKNDATAVGHALAEDWTIVLGNGELMSREQLLKAISGGKLKFSKYDVSSLQVRLEGDAAIVIGIGESEGQWEGTSFKERERFTDVFLRKDGKWRCVSSHSSRITEE